LGKSKRRRNLNSAEIGKQKAISNSLLNTAKLMEENQTLYRLKELEFLEKICDKIESLLPEGTVCWNS